MSPPPRVWSLLSEETEVAGGVGCESSDTATFESEVADSTDGEMRGLIFGLGPITGKGDETTSSAVLSITCGIDKDFLSEVIFILLGEFA